MYKYGFYIIILNDAVATYCVCANLMLTALHGYTRSNWPVSVLLMSTGLSAFMEQTFLIVSGFISLAWWFCSQPRQHRYYTVSAQVVIVFKPRLILCCLAARAWP